MAWVAQLGSTLMLRSGPWYKEHLHFVLNDPMDFYEEATQSCLVVCATTVYEPDKCDQTCILPGRCHKFIGHDSYVPYHWAEVRRAVELEALVTNKVFRDHEPVDVAFVRRLVSGMIDSPRTSRRHKRHAKQVWAVLQTL